MSDGDIRRSGSSSGAAFCRDAPPTEIYTLSLHDALPIFQVFTHAIGDRAVRLALDSYEARRTARSDRKSTRLNSSHPSISYAVFCLKKKTTMPCPFCAQIASSHPPSS